MRSSHIGAILYIGLMFVLGLYFTYASVQGEFGIFERAQIEAEAELLEAERARLQADVALLRNKTHRLSDSYLDLDLLDEQARNVLGFVRADEIVVR